jgi:diamine N-acetyltransferase
MDYTIHFEKVTFDNYRDCMRLNVAADQAHYTATVARSLAKAYVCYDCARPMIIYDDETMIGYVLYRNHDELNQYVIDHLLIDEQFQGKGYGTAAMKLLIETFKKERKYPKASLCYKEDNQGARRLYGKMGFRPTGEEEANEIVVELDLQNI